MRISSLPSMPHFLPIISMILTFWLHLARSKIIEAPRYGIFCSIFFFLGRNIHISTLSDAVTCAFRWRDSGINDTKYSTQYFLIHRAIDETDPNIQKLLNGKSLWVTRYKTEKRSMEDACCHYAFTFSLLILHLDTNILSILFSHVLSLGFCLSHQVSYHKKQQGAWL